jgi:3-dehydroquinate synthase
MTDQTVRVDLAGRSYDILIGGGLLAGAGAAIRERLGRRRIVTVTDDTVAGHHLPALEAALAAADLPFQTVIIAPGEASKDLRRFPDFAERLLDCGLDRSSVILAFGGGVVGDLAGFAAATLLRGIDFVQAPTTLLAQIDSSVGGKTAVDARQGKNLVGAFYQPRLVLADLDVLATLPRRELLAGYAEMVKYGLLGDATFFAWLDAHHAAVLAGHAAPLAEAVAHCCRMKSEIVAEDERETGRRALLNLGHTFGHAIETETGFSAALLHGEAVALGILLAAELSVALGRLPREDATRIRAHFKAAGLPTDPALLQGAPFPAGNLLGHMRHDKKTVDGRLTFILLDAIGIAAIARDVAEDAVRRVLIEQGVAA